VPRVFVDTNVFVYLFDADAAAKRARARALLEAVGSEIVVSTQVMQEFYVTVTRKLATPLPPAEAEAATRDLAAFNVVVTDASMVLRAIARVRTAAISFWDALIVEAAIEAGCERLLSEDLQAGQQFGNLTIENPFSKQ
jgi:predicted nucleic acid-binding protein